MEEVKPSSYDYMAKVIIIGDSGVGKTNYITRLCENHFKQSYVATIGVDFKIKTFSHQGKKYKMQIWDTAGQERFRNITQTYYKGAAGIILAYSITDRVSFNSIEKWMTQIDNHASEDVCRIIVGTKGDLEAERQVSTEEGIAMAQKHKLQYTEISSKDGKNVQESIHTLVQEIGRVFEKNADAAGVRSQRDLTIRGGKNQSERKNCSC